jgi:hypothetical protein
MRRQSLKQMASQIVARIIERWQRELASTDPHHQFDTTNFKFKLTKWIDDVSAISDAALNAALRAKSDFEIDGHFYSPYDLQIVKELYASTIAASLVEAHDKRQRHVPVDKLFQASLLPPEFLYEEARRQWLVLGDTQRVEVAYATNEQWRLHDGIKDTNFRAQQDAYLVDVDARKRREKLFRQNPECTNTDDLMKKLGAWKPH